MVRTSARVVLTRSRADNAALAFDLQALGITVIEAPTAEIHAVPVDPPIETVSGWLAQAGAAVATSRPGAEAALAQIGATTLAEFTHRGGILATVGPSTAAVWQQAGLEVAVVATAPATADNLSILLNNTLTPGSAVVHFQGRQARAELRAGLTGGGHTVHGAVVYENAEPAPPNATVRDQCVHADLVFYAAPSAAARALAWMPDLRHVPAAALGPTTAAALRDLHGLSCVAIAASPKESDVLAAIVAALA